MLNLSINNKNYEVTNCYENITWNGSSKSDIIFLNIPDVTAKDELSKLIGQTVPAILQKNSTTILTIDNTFIFKSIVINIPSDEILIQFEKSII